MVSSGSAVDMYTLLITVRHYVGCDAMHADMSACKYTRKWYKGIVEFNPLLTDFL